MSQRQPGDWRVKLVLHYDGRNFFGWQTQRNRRTVQDELSDLIERLCGSRRKLVGAGRTDRGVHSTGQVASALIPDRFEASELRRALNSMAPRDLWVASAERVPIDFHPRHDATSRTYIYRLGVTPEAHSPFTARWCWPLGSRLDLSRMRHATASLLGAHDFRAFGKSGQPRRGVRCHVIAAGWAESAVDSGILEFEISANRFLHRMVRYIVGTLVEVGQGRRPADDIRRLLERDEDLVTSAPAPAQGLWLTQVRYDGQVDGPGRAQETAEIAESRE